jgi:queuine tRNA-ribosyltransferase
MAAAGAHQIFSMGHGSVSDEIKGRRNKDAAADSGGGGGGSGGGGSKQSLLSIGEKGARFKSYHDGSIKV